MNHGDKLTMRFVKVGGHIADPVLVTYQKPCHGHPDCHEVMRADGVIAFVSSDELTSA